MAIFILFLSMVLNGIFAMAEIALVSSRQARLQQRAEKGERGAEVALELLVEPNRFLSTVQIGITLVGIFSGAFGASQLSGPLADLFARVPFLESFADELAFIILVVIITYFSLVIGELIPKRVAMNNPEAISSSLAIPFKFLSKITKPIVDILSASSELGVRLLGIKPGDEPEITEEEIKVLINQGYKSGIFKAAEKEMVSGVFRLDERNVEAVMTPRLKVTWIDVNDRSETIWEKIINSSYSQIPVADGDLDSIVGFVQIKDFLDQSPNDPDFKLKTFIKEPLYIPENIPATKALDRFQIKGVTFAVVIDEFGGTVGIVTDYDIMKTILGDIPDQGETLDNMAFQREDGSWLFDGLIVIDELKEYLNLAELPGEDTGVFQTLSGFVMSQLGKIPKTGAKFSFEDYEFEIVDMDGRRVDRVLVTQRTKTK
jgi:putative hemolysin